MEIMEMKKKDLPNATAVLVLGILSLVFCWCYGFVGLVLGILAVAIASGPRTGLWYCWNLRGVGCCRFRDFNDIGCNGAGRRVGIDARLK